MLRRPSLLIAAVCAAGLLAACQPLVVQRAPVQTQAEDPVVQYLKFQRRLKSMDQAMLDAAFKQMYDDYSDEATADRRLRLALIMSAPNYAKRDEAVARDQLLRLLRSDQELPPSVFDFVLLQLDELVYRSRLRTQTVGTEEGGTATDEAQRVARLKARVQELEAELAEAERKIQGLQQIEESLDQTELENAAP